MAMKDMRPKKRRHGPLPDPNSTYRLKLAKLEQRQAIIKTMAARLHVAEIVAVSHIIAEVPAHVTDATERRHIAKGFLRHIEYITLGTHHTGIRSYATLWGANTDQVRNMRKADRVRQVFGEPIGEPPPQWSPSSLSDWKKEYMHVAAYAPKGIPPCRPWQVWGTGANRNKALRKAWADLICPPLLDDSTSPQPSPAIEQNESAGPTQPPAENIASMATAA